MLQEPGTSQYDLQFNVLGFPVRIAWGFWLVAAVLGWNWSIGVDSIRRIPDVDSPGPPALLLIWAAALLLSILVHELGHAIAMRYYGLNCRVVLYHFGGLAIPDSFGSWNGARHRRLGPREQIVISAAGPAAQLLLALIVWFIGWRLGVRMQMTDWINSLFGAGLDKPPFPSSAAVFGLFDALIYPSTVWAILNLAPILPLDGGNIMRSGLMLSRINDPQRAAHIVSIGFGALIGLYFLQSGEIFGIMFLLFAANNWQAMQSNYRGF